jgi:hypothetical protein
MSADRETTIRTSYQALALLDLCEMTAKRLEDEGHPTGSLARVLKTAAEKFGEVHDFVERASKKAASA